MDYFFDSSEPISQRSSVTDPKTKTLDYTAVDARKTLMLTPFAVVLLKIKDVFLIYEALLKMNNVNCDYSISVHCPYGCIVLTTLLPSNLTVFSLASACFGYKDLAIFRELQYLRTYARVM
jgi:hypothetical protein